MSAPVRRSTARLAAARLPQNEDRDPTQRLEAERPHCMQVQFVRDVFQRREGLHMSLPRAYTTSTIRRWMRSRIVPLVGWRGLDRESVSRQLRGIGGPYAELSGIY